MEWLFYMFFACVIWGMAVMVDRFALSGQVKSKKFYTLIPAFSKFVVLIPFFFVVNMQMGAHAFIVAFIVGVIQFFLLFFFYTCLGLEEVSRVLPLSATFSSLFAWLLSWKFLHQGLTSAETLAFFLFIIGGVLLSFKHRNRKLILTAAMIPIVIAGVFGALEAVVMKHALSLAPLLPAFLVMEMGTFVCGLVLLSFSWREISGQFKAISGKLKLILTCNQLFALIGDFLFFAALLTTSPAMVKSSQGIQHAFVFIMATLITLWKPGLLKEDLHKGELFRKAVGIALIILAVHRL